jgi:hypothetical protein
MKNAIIVVALLAGCIKPPTEKTQTGPTIEVTIKPDTGFDATSFETNPYITLPTNATQYSFKLIVDTTKGYVSGDSNNEPEVTEVNASIMLAGANIPTLTLTVDTTMSEWSYTSQSLTVPSSFKNQSMMVHSDAHDETGLSSNIINFNCGLH